MIKLTQHAQERMELRGVNIAQIREALAKGNVKKNHHGFYVQNYVQGQKNFPLRVAYVIQNKQIIIKSVFFKGLPDY